MPRSKLDTLIYATILLTPMAVAAGYIAFTPAPAPIVIEVPGAASECPEPAALAPPACEASEPAATAPTPVPEPEPASEPATRQAGAGMLLYDHQLVLATAPDLTWSSGQLRNHKLEWAVAVSKRVDITRLPDELRALADARIIVYAADGSTCTATTRPDGLTIHGRQDGEIAYPEDGNDDLTPAQQQAVREQVFAEAQLLRARLHRDGERCDGVWARAAALPAPAVFAARDSDDSELRASVLTELAADPRTQAFARTYRQHNKESGAEQPEWPVYLKDTLQVTRWDELGGPRSYLNVVLGDGGEACSDLFYEQLALLFAVTEHGLVLLDQPGFLDPLAIMDLERDGQLEAVTGGGMHLESRGLPGTVQRFEIPYHGCPC